MATDTLTLEIGSGTGLDLAHHPDDLDELVLAVDAPDLALHEIGLVV